MIANCRGCKRLIRDDQAGLCGGCRHTRLGIPWSFMQYDRKHGDTLVSRDEAEKWIETERAWGRRYVRATFLGCSLGVLAGYGVMVLLRAWGVLP